VEVWLPVRNNGELLGHIHLRASYDIHSRIVAYFGIFAAVMLAGIGLALVSSAALTRLITAPLDSMAAVAREVVGRRDYALRARKISEDEVGVVVDAFNSMLDEVQQRTRALEQSNAALMVEVATRQAAEEALARANARLESAMAAAEIGSWIHDPRRDEIVADRNLVAIFGLGGTRELRGPAALLGRYIHPDDRELLRTARDAAFATGTLYSPAFRVIRADGTLRWVAARGKVQYAGGRPVLLAGLLLDITAQKEAESALRESERLYRAIGESLDYGVWICDDKGRNVYVSESFLRLVGLSQEECADHGWFSLLHPDEAAATLAAWCDCVRDECAWYREHRVRGVDGHYHPVLALGVPVRDERGRVTGWAGINLDISRLKHTEEALREADRRKDEFLATLAHELRNPLAPIRHAVRLLEDPAVDSVRHEWARAVIARQVHRMALLLDDLLDVSRITRGRLSLKKSPVRLDALVESAIETARPLIEARRQRLEIDLDEPARVLEVDALRVSQALSNLLTNAAKYTDDEGRITLVTRREGEELVVAVADTGIGLAPEALSKVFEIFTQIGSAIDRAEGGLGIGLALVRGLVALHGGSVEAHSAGLGQGSEFRIRLPVSCIVEAGLEPAGASRKPAACEPGSCKVLVADDNRDAADTLAMVLEGFGHRVWVAYSGGEAIATARLQQPAVVILDIGMPDLTGYEVASALRAEPAGRGMLLLAITGWGQDVDRRRALDAGFDRHLTKPVDAQQVQQAIEEHLARQSGREPPSPAAVALTGS
ncbi:MAG: PAS domain-containing protein, partial [Gammaproteobacteria bacterium]